MKTLRESTAGYFTSIPDVLNSPSVHNLTKRIVEMALDKDPVDAYHDIRLALACAEHRLSQIEQGKPIEAQPTYQERVACQSQNELK